MIEMRWLKRKTDTGFYRDGLPETRSERVLQYRQKIQGMGEDFETTFGWSEWIDVEEVEE